jgi:hypothetical protein
MDFRVFFGFYGAGLQTQAKEKSAKSGEKTR